VPGHASASAGVYSVQAADDPPYTATSLLVAGRHAEAAMMTRRIIETAYPAADREPGNQPTNYARTLLILALCNVYHYHAQGYLIATTSVGQLSRVFDETSMCLGARTWRTLRSVILPIIAPAIVSIGVFFFVRSMVTLSAVIFLVTPSTQLAAVSVLLLDDSGNQNQAAAFSVCIMAIVAAALALFHGLLRLNARRRATSISRR